MDQRDFTVPSPDELLAILANDATASWFAIDGQLRITWTNRAACALLRMADPVGRSAIELVHPNDLGLVAESLESLEGAQKLVLPTVLRVLNGDGEYIPVEIWVQHTGSPESATYVVFSLRDARPTVSVDDYLVSAMRGEDPHTSLGHLSRALESQLPGIGVVHWGWNGRRFEHAVSSHPDFEPAEMLRTDSRPVESSSNDSRLPWERATARNSYVETLDLSTLALSPDLRAATKRAGLSSCHAQGVESAERERGALVLWDTLTLPLSAGGRRIMERTAKFAMLALDRYALDMQLHRRATTDSLTGLANRTVLFEDLQSLITEGVPSALLLMDLDGFKAVNDTYGHPIGDKVLEGVASRLLAAVRSGDVVARLGGDEFGVLVRNTSDAKIIRDIATRVIATCRQPFILGRIRVKVGMSVGVTATNAHPTSEDAISAADRALYSSKSERCQQPHFDATETTDTFVEDEPPIGSDHSAVS